MRLIMMPSEFIPMDRFHNRFLTPFYHLKLLRTHRIVYLNMLLVLATNNITCELPTRNYRKRHIGNFYKYNKYIQLRLYIVCKYNVN
jgi:hypothetical protein